MSSTEPSVSGGEPSPISPSAAPTRGTVECSHTAHAKHLDSDAEMSSHASQAEGGSGDGNGEVKPECSPPLDSCPIQAHSQDKESPQKSPLEKIETDLCSLKLEAPSLEIDSGDSEKVTNVSPNSSPNNLSQEYHLKWIKWKGNSKVPIVTQNSNGSCPLLAIINVLLLRQNICFPPMIEIVTASQLMDYLCDCILSNVPKNLPETAKLNYEQNFQDAMSILPRLPTGLDVNVRFTGISDFEYTPECIIFDLLHIPLYHGWLLDPAHSEVSRVVNNLSYNQLVDRIITSKGSPDPKVNSEMFIAEEFLNQTASQLTLHGLSRLIHYVKEDELCILFRNNHFITLYKYKSKLYQLVTDQGFLTEPNVVWESLNNIEGDTYFVDSDFVLVPPKPSVQSATFTTTQQQIDQDYLIALSLDEEQKLQNQRTAVPEESAKLEESADSALIADSGLSDEELAKKLQAEENQYYERQKSHSSSSASNASQSRKSTTAPNVAGSSRRSLSSQQSSSASSRPPHPTSTHHSGRGVSNGRSSTEQQHQQSHPNDRDSVSSREKSKNCTIS